MLSSTIQIQPVSVAGHFNDIETLAREIWTEHYTPIIGAAQVAYMLDKFQSAEAMQAQVKAGYEYFMIRKEQEPAGYFSFKQEKEGLFLSKIYVLSKLRGQGIGRKAVEVVVKEAEKRHLKSIRLTVNKYNTQAIATYRKMGFRQTRELVMDIGGGFVMDDYEMRKELS